MKVPVSVCPSAGRVRCRRLTEHGCCFCAGAIEDIDASDIRALVVTWGDETELTWWAHEGCFREALHPEYRPPPDPSDMIRAIQAFEAGEANRASEE